MVIIGTMKTYNDGKWHRLDAGRYFTSCSLRVDNEILKMVSTSDVKEITSLDTMNFGGNNKGIIHVTSKGFDGCLRQISIDGVNIDLSDNVESVGIAYGCQVNQNPLKIVHVTGTVCTCLYMIRVHQLFEFYFSLHRSYRSPEKTVTFGLSI